MILTEMKQEHVSQVAALEKICFSDPWSENSVAHEVTNKLAYWLVALEGDTVVGYIGSQTVMEETDMMNVAVHPDYRRKGIAEALVNGLVEALKERGSHCLTLEVRASNEPAKSLYEKLGFSYGTYQKKIVASVKWDFAAYTPDLIVVNLGTNDDSYTQNSRERQREYCEAYTAFLKEIRSHNPDAKILCTLGVMGDRLYPWVEKAAKDYTEQTGDTNIACMRFSVQSPADGYAADWHPTKATHDKAAQKLTAEIRELMGW